MGLDFLILFLGACGFYWLAGRLIDDVLEQGEREWAAWQDYRKARER